jgi:predicted Zn-dependent peptidase
MLGLMQQAVAALRSGQHLEADFARARRQVLASVVAESRHSTSIAMDITFEARFGLEPGFDDRLAEQVATLTLAEVQALAAEELSEQGEVVVVAGAAKQVQAVFAAAGLPAPTMLAPWPTETAH